MDAATGFAEAKRLLQQHFGDNILIGNAYMGKALKLEQYKGRGWKSIEWICSFSERLLYCNARSAGHGGT